MRLPVREQRTGQLPEPAFGLRLLDPRCRRSVHRCSMADSLMSLPVSSPTIPPSRITSARSASLRRSPPSRRRRGSPPRRRAPTPQSRRRCPRGRRRRHRGSVRRAAAGRHPSAGRGRKRPSAGCRRSGGPPRRPGAGLRGRSCRLSAAARARSFFRLTNPSSGRLATVLGVQVARHGLPEEQPFRLPVLADRGDPVRDRDAGVLHHELDAVAFHGAPRRAEDAVDRVQQLRPPRPHEAGDAEDLPARTWKEMPSSFPWRGRRTRRRSRRLRRAARTPRPVTGISLPTMCQIIRSLRISDFSKVAAMPPSRRITQRSQSSVTSSRRCDTYRTDVPPATASRTFSKSHRVWSSERQAVGSSRSRMSGFSPRARTISTICCWAMPSSPTSFAGGMSSPQLARTLPASAVIRRQSISPHRFPEPVVDEDVLGDTHCEEEVQLLEDAGDAGRFRVLRRSGPVLLAVQEHPARSAQGGPPRDLEQRALPGTVRTDEADDLAGGQLEADVVQCLEAAEALADPGERQDGGSHDRSLRESRPRRGAGGRSSLRFERLLVELADPVGGDLRRQPVGIGPRGVDLRRRGRCLPRPGAAAGRPWEPSRPAGA